MKKQLKKLIKRKQDIIRELENIENKISRINLILIQERKKELQKKLTTI